MQDGTRAAMATAAAAYLRFAERARTADRERPTRLAGWSVGDLIDHVAWGAAMEAAALRSAAGSPAEDRPDDADGLDGAVSAFTAATRLDVDPATLVALPAGTVPLAYAAPLFAFEAALHAADLDHALTGGEPALRPEELAACEVVIGPMLDLVAAAAPADDVVIDLIGLGAGIRLSTGDGGWHRSVPDDRAATTTLSGSPQEIVLLTTGRIDAERLCSGGSAEHARRFKTYFPGP